MRAGLVASTDLLPERHPPAAHGGAQAFDLTTAAAFAAAARGGAAAACVLVVAGVLRGHALDGDALEAAERTLGALGAAAVSGAPAAAA